MEEAHSIQHFILPTFPIQIINNVKLLKKPLRT